MKINNLKWSDISNYRNELYGLSIISVMILHYTNLFMDCPPDNPIFYFIIKAFNVAIGSVGVDIFLFLSGYSIFYSLDKKEKSLMKFYSRRLRRVIYPYLIVGLFYWIILDFAINNDTVYTFILDYSLFSVWTFGNKTFWYIACIIFLYVLSPFIYKICDKLSYILVCISVWLICCIIINIYAHDYFNLNAILLLRIPIYLFGMHCGYLSKREKTIPKFLWLITFLSFFVKLWLGINDNEFYRIFFSCYSVFLIMLYVVIVKCYGEIIKAPRNFVKKVGKYSLELYILHLPIKNLAECIGVDTKILLNYVVCMLISIVLSLLLYRIQENNEKKELV